MNKLLFGSACFLFLFSLSVSNARASLLRITQKGEVYWNVLGLTDNYMEVKKIATNAVVAGSSISLANNGGNVVISSEGGNVVELGDYKEEILEMEASEAASTVLIRAQGQEFVIEQNGIKVRTSFPIKVDSKKNKLLVETQTGDKFLSILPEPALMQLIRTNIISSINESGVDIREKEQGEVIYFVNGKKSILLFNIFMLDVPIKVEISATSGSVLKVDQPLWYSVVDFLLA